MHEHSQKRTERCRTESVVSVWVVSEVNCESVALRGSCAEVLGPEHQVVRLRSHAKRGGNATLSSEREESWPHFLSDRVCSKPTQVTLSGRRQHGQKDQDESDDFV